MSTCDALVSGHVIVDLCANTSYESLSYIYLKDLTSEQCEEKWRKFGHPEPRRYILPLKVNQQVMHMKMPVRRRFVLKIHVLIIKLP